MAKVAEKMADYVRAGLERLEQAWNLHPKGKALILNERGAGAYEAPDPVPMAPPVGYVRHVPLHEQIRQMVRSEALRQAAIDAGAETFEEGDDFDVGDDYDPRSPHEYEFDPGDSNAPIPGSQVRSGQESSQGRPQGAAEPAQPLDGSDAPDDSAEPPAAGGSPEPKKRSKKD